MSDETAANEAATPPVAPTVTATGFSNRLDFGEAFLNAVRKLPPAPNFPDALYHVRVIHTGGDFGGIAGLSRLSVTVERGGETSRVEFERQAATQGQETDNMAGARLASVGDAPPVAFRLYSGADDDPSHLFESPSGEPVQYGAVSLFSSGLVSAKGVKRTAGGQVFLRAIPTKEESPLRLPSRFELREVDGPGADVLTPFEVSARCAPVGKIVVVDAAGEHEITVRRTDDPR